MLGGATETEQLCVKKQNFPSIHQHTGRISQANITNTSHQDIFFAFSLFTDLSDLAVFEENFHNISVDALLLMIDERRLTLFGTYRSEFPPKFS